MNEGKLVNKSKVSGKGEIDGEKGVGRGLRREKQVGVTRRAENNEETREKDKQKKRIKEKEEVGGKGDKRRKKIMAQGKEVSEGKKIT